MNNSIIPLSSIHIWELRMAHPRPGRSGHERLRENALMLSEKMFCGSVISLVCMNLTRRLQGHGENKSVFVCSGNLKVDML